MTTAWMIRDKDGRFTPADRMSTDALARIKPGARVRCDVRQPRNGAHHRKFWALATATAEALGDEWTAENVVTFLKLNTGHVKAYRIGGQVVAVPASIAFAEMDEAAFSAFHDRCIAVILRDLMPGATSDGLRAAVEDLIG